MFFWRLRSVGRGEIHALVSTFKHTSLVLGLGLSFHTPGMLLGYFLKTFISVWSWYWVED